MPDKPTDLAQAFANNPQQPGPVPPRRDLPPLEADARPGVDRLARGLDDMFTDLDTKETQR